MFQSLRPNSQIYILHKGDSPYFETGYITNVSTPRSKYGQVPNFTAPQDLIVDIVVKVNDTVMNYNNLPANLDIADSYSNGDPIVISDSKDAINVEVMNLKKKSSDIVDSVELHKNLIVAYEKILGEINPEIAEKQTQKNEINIIKNQLSEMTKNMSELMQANRLLMEQLTKQKNESLGNFGKA